MPNLRVGLQLNENATEIVEVISSRVQVDRCTLTYPNLMLAFAQPLPEKGEKGYKSYQKSQKTTDPIGHPPCGRKYHARYKHFDWRNSYCPTAPQSAIPRGQSSIPLPVGINQPHGHLEWALSGSGRESKSEYSLRATQDANAWSSHQPNIDRISCSKCHLTRTTT